VLWSIADEFERVLVVCNAVDEVNKDKMVPGVGPLVERLEQAARLEAAREARTTQPQLAAHASRASNAGRAPVRRRFRTMG
jgi:hypothetical protein